MRRARLLCLVCVSLGLVSTPLPAGLLLRLDFTSPPADLALHHGLKIVTLGQATGLEFTTPLQFANLPFSRKFDGLVAMTATPKDEQTSPEAPLRPLPVTFYEFTALITPRPLLVFQAVGERRPNEEQNAAAVAQVYTALGAAEQVRYLWHPGDHDYPPAARAHAVKWITRAFGVSH